MPVSPNRASASARSVPSPRSAWETTQRSPSRSTLARCSRRVANRRACHGAPSLHSRSLATNPGRPAPQLPGQPPAQQVGIQPAAVIEREEPAVEHDSVLGEALGQLLAELGEGGHGIGHALGLEANQSAAVDPGQRADAGPPRFEEVGRVVERPRSNGRLHRCQARRQALAGLGRDREVELLSGHDPRVRRSCGAAGAGPPPSPRSSSPASTGTPSRAWPSPAGPPPPCDPGARPRPRPRGRPSGR